MSVVDRNNIETQHDLEGLPRHLLLTVATPTYQMRVSDTVMIVISEATAGAGIITLPSLAEAVGKFYFISAPTGGATDDDISLYQKETGAELTTYGALDTDDDHVILFSDGTKWRIALNGITG